MVNYSCLTYLSVFIAKSSFHRTEMNCLYAQHKQMLSHVDSREAMGGKFQKEWKFRSIDSAGSENCNFRLRFGTRTKCDAHLKVITPLRVKSEQNRVRFIWITSCRVLLHRATGSGAEPRNIRNRSPSGPAWPAVSAAPNWTTALALELEAPATETATSAPTPPSSRLLPRTFLKDEEPVRRWTTLFFSSVTPRVLPRHTKRF